MGENGLLDTVAERLGPAGTGARVVTVAGPVAVGKSTFARALGDRLERRGATCEVVSTDGFLWPNAVLEARGLLTAKGVPATYDLDALEALVDAARAGVATLTVPRYSHRRYDVEAEPDRVARPDVVVVEGVVALQRPVGDVAVFLDADDDDLVRWYAHRFAAHVAAAADDPDSFYRAWIDLGPDEVDALARTVWALVNQPNVDEHIRPTADRAHVVVRKGPDHGIREVAWRTP